MLKSPVKRQQPERQEQAAIVKLLKLLGASVYVIGTVRPRGDRPDTGNTPGVPDLWVTMPLPGRLRAQEPRSRLPLWIEVKAPSGRPSEAQTQFREESLQAKVPHILGGVTEVTAWLKQGGWIK